MKVIAGKKLSLSVQRVWSEAAMEKRNNIPY